MIPKRVFLTTFPLNNNGKVDKRKLSKLIQGDAAKVSSGSELETYTEHKIGNLWKELLGIPVVYKESDFFAVGGNSFKVAKLLALLRELGYDIPFAVLWKHSKLCDLATYLVNEKGCEKISKLPLSANAYPLTEVQRRMLLLEHQAPGAYNVPLKLVLAPGICLDKLNEAFRQVLRRHSVLCTAYSDFTAGSLQDKWADSFMIERGDVENQTAFAAKPFDLSSEPSIRALYVATSNELILVGHHIMIDGWCIRKIVEELIQFYNGTQDNAPQFLYQDYAFSRAQASAEKGQVIDRNVQFWVDQFDGSIPSLGVFKQSGAACMSGAEIATLQLDASLVERLRILSESLEVSLFVLYLSAYQILLTRYFSESDVVIGIPVSLRDRAELVDMIGMFVNTIGLRLQLDENMELVDLLKTNNGRWKETIPHQDAPLEKVVSALGLGNKALFRTIFNFIPEVSFGDLCEELVADVKPMPPTHPVCDLVFEVSSEKQCSVTFDTSKWNSTMASRFLESYSTLLGSILESSNEVQVKKLDILDAATKFDLARALSGPVRDNENELLFHQFVERAANEHPDVVALKMLDDEMTYREFDERANQLANYLISKGIQVEDCIGVLFPRGFDQMVAVFGILKAGATYVPLDIAYPYERINAIIGACNMRYCLAHSSMLDISITLDSLDWGLLPKTRPTNVGVGLNNVAYILFTSGSTGKPKGVQIEHGSIANLGEHCFTTYPVEFTSALGTSRLSWDASVVTMLVAFTRACTLCVIPPEYANSLPEHLSMLCREMRVSMLLGPPSCLGFLDGNFPDLKLVYVGGDVLSPQFAQRWLQRGVIVENAYGPTEATVMVTTCKVTDTMCTSGESIPIGKPFQNIQLYVMDEYLRLVPTGVPGELVIGGGSLARGYLGLKRINEAFIENPFCSSERVYRTGDVVRLREDGELEFLGRKGGYVKIRGYRVDLAEVSTVVEEHPDVVQCVTVVHKERLYSFVSVRIGNTLELDHLLSMCNSKLTDYMIPCKFTIVEQFETDANGKVDRKKLLQLLQTEVQAPAEQVANSITDPYELEVCKLWADALDVSPGSISRDGDFFNTYSGNSFLAIEVLSCMRERLGIDISVREFYSNPTVAACALQKQECVEKVLDKALAREDISVLGDRKTNPVGVAMFKVFGLFAVYGIVGIALLPTFAVIRGFGYGVESRLFIVNALILVLALGLFMVTLPIVVWVVKTLLIGKRQTNRIVAPFSWKHFRIWVVDRLWDMIVGWIAETFGGTTLLPIIYRGFGARIGKNVFLDDTVLRNPELVDIGDGSIVERGAVLETFVELPSGSIMLDRVKVGSRCIIEPNTVLGLGCKIGDGAVVCALTHIERRRVVEENVEVKSLESRDIGSPDMVGKMNKGNGPPGPADDHDEVVYALEEMSQSVPMILFQMFQGLLVQTPFLISVLLRGCVIGAIFNSGASTELYFVLGFILLFPFISIFINFVTLGLVFGVRKLIMPKRLSARAYRVDSFKFSCCWAGIKLFENCIASYKQTVFSRIAILLCGGDVNLANVLGVEALEPSLFSSGSGSFMANGVQVRPVSFTRNGCAHFGRVEIGDACQLFDRAVIKPGVCLERNVKIGAVTAVDKAEICENQIMFGIPCIQKKIAPLEGVVHGSNLMLVMLQDSILQYSNWLFAGIPRVLLMSLGLLVVLNMSHWGWLVLVSVFGTPILCLLYALLVLCIGVCLKWALIGKFKEGEMGSFFLWEMVNHVLHGAPRSVLCAVDLKPLTSLFYRLLGAKIGERVHLDPNCLILEADLTSIGEDTWVESFSTLFCHTFNYSKLQLLPVKVGNNAVVGQNSVVLPGCVIDDDTELCPLTALLPNQHISGGTFTGSPATLKSPC